MARAQRYCVAFAWTTELCRGILSSSLYVHYAEPIHLVVVSGTGEMDAEFLSAGTVDPDVVASVTTYLERGGTSNITECLKFLSDRLLLTGHGYEKPTTPAEHGIYMQDLEHAEYEDWLQRADPAKPTAAILFYRAHLLSGNIAFVDALAEALESHGLNALCIFTSSMKAMEDGFPAALRLMERRVNVHRHYVVFCIGRDQYRRSDTGWRECFNPGAIGSSQ